MDKFSETVTVTTAADGYVAASVHRVYDDGIEYRSVLHFQSADAAALADAIERFSGGQKNETVTLSDGTIRLFSPYRSTMLNMELQRAPDVPHGGQDTMDMSPDSLPTMIAGLRQPGA